MARLSHNYSRNQGHKDPQKCVDTHTSYHRAFSSAAESPHFVFAQNRCDIGKKIAPENTPIRFLPTLVPHH